MESRTSEWLSTRTLGERMERRTCPPLMMQPPLTDRRVVWTDLVGHNGFSPLSNIYFYDFVWGGDPFPVNMDAQVIWAPIIDGNTIVWGAYDNGNHATIYGATIGHLPEPGTIVMFAFGFLGIAGTVVRRMRK